MTYSLTYAVGVLKVKQHNGIDPDDSSQFELSLLRNGTEIEGHSHLLGMFQFQYRNVGI